MTSNSSDRYVLLCGGFQKSGTTWMDQEWLGKHPEIHRDIVKEFHVLENVFSDDLRVRQIGANEKIKEIEMLASSHFQTLSEGENSNLLNEEVINSSLLFHFITNPSAYFDYFKNLFDRYKKKCMYDLTTEHCFVDFGGWVKILKEFARRGIRVKILCMVRDPIERIHSAVRMKAQAKFGEYWTKAQEDEIFTKFSRGYLFQQRTKYNVKIPVYEKVVGKENVFTVFYEELFNGIDDFKELCEFLEISYMKPEIANKVNESKYYYDLTDLTKKWLLEEYQETYDWAEKVFGKDRIRNIWQF